MHAMLLCRRGPLLVALFGLGAGFGRNIVGGWFFGVRGLRRRGFLGNDASLPLRVLAGCTNI